MPAKYEIPILIVSLIILGLVVLIYNNTKKPMMKFNMNSPNCMDNCMKDPKENEFSCKRTCGLDTYSDQYPWHSPKECVSSLQNDNLCGNDLYQCKKICGDYNYSCLVNCLPEKPNQEQIKSCYMKCMD